MFIRSHYTEKDDKTYGPYYSIVKTKREGDKVKQEMVKYLGKDPDLSTVPESMLKEYNYPTTFEELLDIQKEEKDESIAEENRTIDEFDDEKRSEQSDVESKTDDDAETEKNHEEDDENVELELKNEINGWILEEKKDNIVYSKENCTSTHNLIIQESDRSNGDTRFEIVQEDQKNGKIINSNTIRTYITSKKHAVKLAEDRMKEA